MRCRADKVNQPCSFHTWFYAKDQREKYLNHKQLNPRCLLLFLECLFPLFCSFHTRSSHRTRSSHHTRSSRNICLLWLKVICIRFACISVKNAFSGLFFSMQKGSRVFQWQEDIVFVISALSSTKPWLSFLTF